MEQATLFQLGKLALEEGDRGEARRRFSESSRISENLGDPVWIVHATFGKALVAWEERLPRAAVEAATSALEEARRLHIGLAAEIESWLARTGQDGEPMS